LNAVSRSYVVEVEVTPLRLVLLRVLYIFLVVFTDCFERGLRTLIDERFFTGEEETVSLSIVSARRRRLDTDPPISLSIVEPQE
jgi:hypothetical protein